MIISYQQKFIFVAIPKTASHSFRAALRPHLGPGDWEQCHLLEKKSFPVAPLAALRHGHLSFLEIRPFLVPGLWDQFFSFCTVRNPYDRFVSHCHFINRGNETMRHDPLSVMKRLLEAPPLPFQPQHRYIADESGRIRVDFIARYETLQEGFDQICLRLGLPKVRLQHINPAKHPPFRECYDPELLEMVRTYYAKDFAMFNYPLELN